MDQAIIIALGGNLAFEGAPVQAVLERALERMPAEGLHPVRRSRWWRSAAWPDPTAPPYLNGVVLAGSELDPRDVLGALMNIEHGLGRRRAETDASRTLDLDLIAHGRQVIDRPHLVLPHPRAAQRLFVMGPLAEIAPDWRHPVLGKTAADLAAHATVGLDAAPQAAEEGAG